MDRCHYLRQSPAMTQGYKHFENARDYTFGCPDGEWTARLDHKAWGKKNNMLLYFTETGTGAKRWLSVFWNDGFNPRDGSFDFKNDGYVGESFVLTTGHSSKTGNPVFQSARRQFDSPKLITLYKRQEELLRQLTAVEPKTPQTPKAPPPDSTGPQNG